MAYEICPTSSLHVECSTQAEYDTLKAWCTTNMPVRAFYADDATRVVTVSGKTRVTLGALAVVTGLLSGML